ncbi:MAG: hypothetical protein ACYCSF_09825 [Acidimicrobiales bacterium]
MTGDLQHYLPAGLLGGFGILPPSHKRRKADLVVRRKATGIVDPGTVKAEDEACQIATYRLIAPPPGVDRDFVDKLWDPVETNIPGLVERLTTRKLQAGDNRLLYSYVAMAGVRHPSFQAVADAWQLAHGAPLPIGDQVQYMREEGVSNQVALLGAWRWRVLHAPDDGPRLMITDRGWMYVGETGREGRALFLPMGPRVALLGYLDAPDLPPRRPPFEEHLDLCQSTIEWFNAGAWFDLPFDTLFAHPDDRKLLEGVPDVDALHLNSHGPYRMRDSSGLFD